MMKLLKYISGFLVILPAFISCDSNDQPYLNVKDANLYFDTDQSKFVPNISESNKTLKVPIILAGIPGTYPITVTIGIDTTNATNAAKEGVDFIIKKKTITFEEGYGIKYVEIKTLDNTEKGPSKQFDLTFDSVSRPLKNNPSNKITITILDDEHPLQQLFGIYHASGLDVFTAGKTDKFNITMSADPTDDATVLISGFPTATNVQFKLRIDLESKQCWLPGGQELGKDPLYGLVVLCRCFKKEDGYLGFDYDDVPGTISDNYTEYLFTNWLGAVVVGEGEHYGAAFFAYKDFKMVKAQ